MYCSFYELSEKPFNLTPDPKFLYLNARYREALATLNYGIAERKGFVTLIGEAGTGKTTLLNKLLEQLTPSTKTVFLFNTNVTFEDILEYIFAEFDLPVHSGKKLYMLQRFNAFLLDELQKGGNVALLIDEAQDLDVSVLEDLRLLSNLETAKEKILQILLSGQPELGQKLASPVLRQLRQRIAINCRLHPLSREEVSEYIEVRLRAAGCADRKLFTREAEEEVWRYSQGIPRLVNVVCDNALVIGYALGKRRIDGEVSKEAAADLLGAEVELATGGADDAAIEPDGEPPAPAPLLESQRRRGTWLIFAVVAVALVTGLLSMGRSMLLRRSGPNVVKAPSSARHRAIIRPGSTDADQPPIAIAGKPPAPDAPDEPWRHPQQVPLRQVPREIHPSDFMRPAASGVAPEASPPVPALRQNMPRAEVRVRREHDVPANAAPPQAEIPPLQTARGSAIAARPAASRLAASGDGDVGQSDEAANAPPGSKVPGMTGPAERRLPTLAVHETGDTGALAVGKSLAAPASRPEAPLGAAATAVQLPAAASAIEKGGQHRETGGGGVYDLSPETAPARAAKQQKKVPFEVAAAPPPAAIAPAPAPPKRRQQRGRLPAPQQFQLTVPQFERVAARPGDSVGKIAVRKYGRANYTILDLLKIANPSLADINRIETGQVIALPELSSSFPTLKDGKGQFRVLVRSTPAARRASALAAGLRRQGFDAEVARVRLGADDIVYRVSVGSFLSETEASTVAEQVWRVFRSNEQLARLGRF